jgi:hypothetical protein
MRELKVVERVVASGIIRAARRANDENPDDRGLRPIGYSVLECSIAVNIRVMECLTKLLAAGCHERGELTRLGCFYCLHPFDEGESHEPDCPFEAAMALYLELCAEMHLQKLPNAPQAPQT